MLSNTEYYEYCKNQFNEIDFSDIELEKEMITAKNKAIYTLVDHAFLPTPTLVIKLDLFIRQRQIGYYELYLKEDNSFFDDVLKLF